MIKTNANFGDFVEVHLDKVIYEGILMQSPESEKDLILLKLGTGYNIGFNKKDVLKIVLKRRLKKEEEKFEIPNVQDKPNIAMIITGGTIASQYDSITGAVKPLDNVQNLFKFYPEIFEIANVSKIEIPFIKSSENMDFKDWIKIAKIAEKFLNDPEIKGIIVTHGTDTLHYTSAALSFFLSGNEKLNKPLVLTFSQRSIDRASSDANLNLRCATLVAISNIAEVSIVGHASENDDYCYVLRGTKVRKMHSSKRDAFKSINDVPIAKVYSNRIDILSKYNLRDDKRKVKLDLNFDNKIALIKFYPGQNPEILNYYIKNKYKGLIIEMTGFGHVSIGESKNNWLKKLKEVIKKGIIVCGVTQTIYGRVNPFVYSSGRELMNIGVIYLNDMLSETAFVKLGWVLGHKNWNVREKMLENVAGEINDRLIF